MNEAFAAARTGTDHGLWEVVETTDHTQSSFNGPDSIRPSLNLMNEKSPELVVLFTHE